MPVTLLPDHPDAPASLDARLRDAMAYEACGRHADARQAYLAILTDAPDDPAALHHLGALLCRTGYRAAARTVFERAAARHPGRADFQVNLAHLLRDAGETAAAWRHYQAALRTAPALPEAHQGLGNLLHDLGETELAEQYWRTGYQDRVFATWPCHAAGDAPRVLLLASVRGGNIPATELLDRARFAVTTVAMEFWRPAMALPPHDVVFNAIGDADLCGAALHAAGDLLRHSAAPVINPPGVVRPTGRCANAARLAGLPDVIAPRMASWDRAALLRPDAAAALAAAGFGWPLLLRAPGFHTGQHFVRVDAPAALAGTAAELPGEALLAIDYIPPRGGDGLWRKYRVMLIDGVLYPLHLAIAPHWKVHYFTAAMADNARHRAEEASFLADMAACLGARATAALARVGELLGLDYAGIDFALGPDGAVVVYEANATMTIVPPPAGPEWDYRRAASARARAAVSDLVVRRAQRGANATPVSRSDCSHSRAAAAASRACGATNAAAGMPVSS